jgi:hypothetical protein
LRFRKAKRGQIIAFDTAGMWRKTDFLWLCRHRPAPL